MPFRETSVARQRYFSIDEIRRFVNASPAAFKDLVRAAIYSGCRYGELCRLRVGDFCADSGTILVAQSKSGRSRHVILASEAMAFFTGLTAGRPGVELMLTRAGEPWGTSNQFVLMRTALAAANIVGGSFHTLRHSYASLAIMGGTPLHVVAHNLGHADDRMVQRHYGHMAASYIAEAIRAHAPE